MLNSIFRSRYVAGVTVIAGGAAVAQAVPVLVTPLLTRLFSPAEFGLFALFTAFMRFASPALNMEYAKAIVSARDDEEGVHLLLLSGIVLLPVTVVATAVLWVLIAQSLLGFELLPLATVWLMAIALLLTGAYQGLRFWLVRTGQYGVISFATVSQSIGRVAMQLVGGLLLSGWWGLALGSVLGLGLGLRRMWVSSSKVIVGVARSADWFTLWQVARAYKKFPLISVPSSVLNSLAIVLPVPLINVYFGIEEAGQYSIAMRILLLPLSLIGMSVADVFHSRLSLIANETPEGAMGFLLKTSGVLFAIALLPMSVVALFGEELWGLVLGKEWTVAGQIASVVTPWALVQFVVSPISRVVAVYQGQELKLVYDILGLVSIVGVLYLGSYWGWSFVKTCAVLGWSQAIVYGVYFVLLVLIVRQRGGSVPQRAR